MKAPMLAIAIPHKGDPVGEDDTDDDMGGDAEEISGQLADLLDVPDDKQGEFADLLHAYVKACAAEDYKE